MSINTFVYPYPINVFIISQLGLTVEQFCELHGYKQSTVGFCCKVFQSRPFSVKSN